MQIIGWLSAILFILAYLLLSLEYISAKRPLYHILNILGAFCLVINAWKIKDYPNITVNAIGAGIAVLSIYQRRFKLKNSLKKGFKRFK